MSSERAKQTAFRLPQRTLDILDKIVEDGKARTRTDALILAVDASENMVLSECSNLGERVADLEKKFSVLGETISVLMDDRKIKEKSERK
jgi:hypothetical protein